MTELLRVPLHPPYDTYREHDEAACVNLCLCLQPTVYYTEPGDVPLRRFHQQAMAGVSAECLIQLMRLQYTTSDI